LARGRKSYAYQLLESLKDEEETDEVYLVSYDFIEDKPNPSFWNNLQKIILDAGGEKIQYSVYYGDRRGAKAVKQLATLYGADVRCFVANELM
jgi:hypothetical protein